MSHASQALVYAMLVDGYYEGSTHRERGRRRSTRTPILRRYAV